MRKLIVLLCFFSLFFIYAKSSDIKTHKLQNGSVHIRIIDEKKNKKWSKYYNNRIYFLLRAYEKYLSKSFHDASKIYYNHLPEKEKWTVKIFGKEKVYLKKRWVGGYNNTSGIFGEPRGIFVEYGLTKVNQPALIFHEIGHFFYYGSGETAWLSEGIVSFLPVILYKQKMLSLEKQEAGSIPPHWGFVNTDHKMDLPVLKDFRKTNPGLFKFWYKKTYKIQFILYKELGAKSYRKFLGELVKNRDKYKTYKSILKLLKKLKNKNWEKLLSGWVTKGKYSKYTWKYFKGKSINDILKIK